MDMLKGADMGVVGVARGEAISLPPPRGSSGSLSGLRMLDFLLPLFSFSQLLLRVLVLSFSARSPFSVENRVRLGAEPPGLDIMGLDIMGLDIMEGGERGDGQSRSENDPPHSSPLQAAESVP